MVGVKVAGEEKKRVKDLSVANIGGKDDGKSGKDGDKDCGKDGDKGGKYGNNKKGRKKPPRR
eukprot:6260393-Alexandrium_andersonii.AAC.1